MSIMTVTGPVEPGKLGYCQCHEHLLIAMGTSHEVHPALWMDDVVASTAEAERYQKIGGTALVDAQPVGCGRMASGLAEISRTVGVRIIASTGFHKLCFYPQNHWIHTVPARTIADLYVKELQEGMFGDGDTAFPGRQTAVKAGIIKTALDRGPLEGRYRELFRAAGEAAIETGRPLMVHIEAGSQPLALLRRLFDMGVSSEQIIFCHTDRACDGEMRRRLADEGIWLEMDTIGRFRYHDDDCELVILHQLMDAGHDGQLLLSLDTTRERLKTYTPGGVGLTYLLETFLPFMREKGVPAETITKLTVENPSIALSGKKQ